MAGTFGIALGATAVGLAVLFLRGLPSPWLVDRGDGGILMALVMATLGIVLILLAYDFGFRQPRS